MPKRLHVRVHTGQRCESGATANHNSELLIVDHHVLRVHVPPFDDKFLQFVYSFATISFRPTPIFCHPQAGMLDSPTFLLRPNKLENIWQAIKQSYAKDTGVAFCKSTSWKPSMCASNSSNTPSASAMPLFPDPPITAIDLSISSSILSTPVFMFCFSPPSGGDEFRTNLLLPFLFRCHPLCFASIHPFCSLTEFPWQTLHVWFLLA